MAVNRYKVSARMWKRWGVEGQRVFNNLYRMMISNQKLFMHLSVSQFLPRVHWKTVAWNAAWIAACEASKSSYS